MKSSPLFFTRTRGLFRECYPGQKSEAPTQVCLHRHHRYYYRYRPHRHHRHHPPSLQEDLKLYMSPVETWCRNLDYYIPDEDGQTNQLDAEQMTRIRE